MMKWWRKRITLGNRRGFTLIELMIVVAIIGILAAIAVPLYQNILSRSRTAKAQADTRSVASAMVQFSAHCGALPGDAGDTCTPAQARNTVASLTVQVCNQAACPPGQLAGPFFVAPGPVPPAGWCGGGACTPANYVIAQGACPGATCGTFSVTATPTNGDNAGAPVVSP